MVNDIITSSIGEKNKPEALWVYFFILNSLEKKFIYRVADIRYNNVNWCNFFPSEGKEFHRPTTKQLVYFLIISVPFLQLY